jgi:hypothetical protein
MMMAIEGRRQEKAVETAVVCSSYDDHGGWVYANRKGFWTRASSRGRHTVHISANSASSVLADNQEDEATGSSHHSATVMTRMSSKEIMVDAEAYLIYTVRYVIVLCPASGRYYIFTASVTAAVMQLPCSSSVHMPHAHFSLVLCS